ncbi:MAG: hypothetical protein ABI273_14260 [Lacunisphaera sp.]
MKKILILFVVMMAIGGILQKIVGSKNVFQSMGTLQKDNDPNSSTRRLAKEQRDFSAKVETEQKQQWANADSELARRLTTLGETEVKLGTNEALIYLFNDSGHNVTFIVQRQDKTKYAPDISVAAGRYEKLLVKNFYRAWVGINGESGKWVLGSDVRPGRYSANIFGCFYK